MNLRTLLSIVLIAIPIFNSFAFEQYSITDLGIAGESVTNVVINDFGRIGITTALQQDRIGNRLIYFDGSSLTDLPTLGYPSGYIADINNNDILAGMSLSAVRSKRSTIYEFGSPSYLIATTDRDSSISAINDAGIVVGQLDESDGSRAFIASKNGVLTMIDTLGGISNYASDVNNYGNVVGYSFLSPNGLEYEAFLYERGVLQSLGTLGGQYSYASGINDKGIVVGQSALSNNELHAYIYDSTVGMRDLGYAGVQSFAKDINESGTIIGGVEISPGNWRAAIFNGTTMPTLLQDLIPANSGWVRLNSATDINNLGHIVGTGVINGEQHAFLLTPVPEPASLAIIGGAFSLAFLRRRLSSIQRT